MAQHEIETTCNLRRWWFYTVLTSHCSYCSYKLSLQANKSRH